MSTAWKTSKYHVYMYCGLQKQFQYCTKEKAMNYQLSRDYKGLC